MTILLQILCVDQIALRNDFRVFLIVMLFFFSFENHVVYFAFKYPLVHTSLMFCYINTEVSEKEKNTNVVSDFPEIFKAEISDFPEILYIMVLSHPLFDSVVI